MEIFSFWWDFNSFHLFAEAPNEQNDENDNDEDLEDEEKREPDVPEDELLNATVNGSIVEGDVIHDLDDDDNIESIYDDEDVEDDDNAIDDDDISCSDSFYSGECRAYLTICN